MAEQLVLKSFFQGFNACEVSKYGVFAGPDLLMVDLITVSTRLFPYYGQLVK